VRRGCPQCRTDDQVRCAQVSNDRPGADVWIDRQETAGESWRELPPRDVAIPDLDDPTALVGRSRNAEEQPRRYALDGARDPWYCSQLAGMSVTSAYDMHRSVEIPGLGSV
jgi:hypothetical protein